MRLFSRTGRRVATTTRAALLALALLATAGGVASAQDDPGSSRGTSFEAVEGPETESVPGGPLLIGAYGTAFLLVLAYVLRLALMQRTTARQLGELERELDAFAKRGGASSGDDDE